MPISQTGTMRSNSGEATLEDYLGAFIKQLRASGLS